MSSLSGRNTSMVPRLIHDMSAGGGNCVHRALSVVETNNEIKSLTVEQEIERIS